MTKKVAETNPLVALLQHIEQHAAPGATAGGADSDGESTVLLDESVNGFRYLLLRTPSRANLKSLLSPREQEIVRMVAKGHPNKIIADVLEISSWTVSTYLRRIFAKLGVASRAAMVARILQDQGMRSLNASPPGAAAGLPRT